MQINYNKNIYKTVWAGKKKKRKKKSANSMKGNGRRVTRTVLGVGNFPTRPKPRSWPLVVRTYTVTVSSEKQSSYICYICSQIPYWVSMRYMIICTQYISLIQMRKHLRKYSNGEGRIVKDTEVSYLNNCSQDTNNQTSSYLMLMCIWSQRQDKFLW